MSYGKPAQAIASERSNPLKGNSWFVPKGLLSRRGIALSLPRRAAQRLSCKDLIGASSFEIKHKSAVWVDKEIAAWLE